MCSSPLLIGTPLLPKSSVVIREVSFGEREHHMHTPVQGTCCHEFVSFLEGCPLYTTVGINMHCKHGEIYLHFMTTFWLSMLCNLGLEVPLHCLSVVTTFGHKWMTAVHKQPSHTQSLFVYLHPGCTEYGHVTSDHVTFSPHHTARTHSPFMILIAAEYAKG